MELQIHRPAFVQAISCLWAVLTLWLILKLHLLSAALSGLLVYQLVHLLSPLLQKRLSGERARLIAVALLATVIVGLLTLAILVGVAFFRSDVGNPQALLAKLASIIEQARAQVPAHVAIYLPDGSEEMRTALFD